MDYGEVQKLWVKGLGYVADKHIYKYKDYSECVFDTQIESKEWLCHELKKVVPENFNHVSVLAGWYGMVTRPLPSIRTLSVLVVDPDAQVFNVI